MISPEFSNFSLETLFFVEEFNFNIDNFVLSDYNYLLFLSDYSNYSNLKFFENNNLYTNSLITFIDQIEDLNKYPNLENITSIYHYSVPNVKLSYPEPFIASPSFIHNDL